MILKNLRQFRSFKSRDANFYLLKKLWYFLKRNHGVPDKLFWVDFF